MVTFYPSSPLISAPLIILYFLSCSKKSAYCSEQINKFVVGQITLSSSFDWSSLIRKIYHQPLLLEKSLHIIRSFWILERRLCWLPWLQGIYVRTSELGFHLHYDNIHFHILNSCEAPCLCPTFTVNVFIWIISVLALIFQRSIFPRCSQY